VTADPYPATDMPPATPGDAGSPGQPLPDPAPAAGAHPGVRQSRLALPGLRLRASERRLLLGVVDFVLLCAALAISMAWRTELLDAPGALASYWYWFVTLLVVWWLVATLLECYDLARAASGPYSMLSAAGAVALTVAIYVWIPVLTPPLLSRKLVLVFGLMAVGGVMVWRGLYAVLFVQPSFHQKALVFGAGEAGRALIKELKGVSAYGNPYQGTGYEIIGFVDDDAAIQAAGQVAGVPVLGAAADLPRLVVERRVDEVVLAITHRHTISEAALTALMACWERGVPICTMPDLYERLLGRVPVDHIGRNLPSLLPAEESSTARFYRALKRTGDILLGVAGMALLGLTIPAVALANLLSSRGPLFYRQTRVGRAGRLFTITKFRTMQPDAENATGAVWASADDPRITPAGRFLRKTRLDELPQLLNILQGHMSFIGPRPERPEFVERLAAQIPFYRARHAVRPGLTGWAQVRYGYGNTVEDARIKLEYDLYYVRHAGLYLDLVILLKTIAVVLGLRGK
jgi:exopolysaccharide biosynthesis polyprenyl glycosylphosphotransferase